MFSKSVPAKQNCKYNLRSPCRFQLKLLGTIASTCSLLLSCSSFEKWVDDKPNHRDFKVRSVWIRPGAAVPHLEFRKINRMTPLLFQGLLIQGNSLDGLVAYKLETGEEKWRLPILNGVEASAVLDSGNIYLGAMNGKFYSIQAENGKVNWEFTSTAEFVAEPLLNSGILYILNGANTLYALDAKTGKQIWMYSRQDTSSISVRGGSTPTFYQGRIYVGFSDGSLVAMSADRGNIVWELQLNKGKKFRDVDSSPVLDGDLIYIAGYDDKLYCLKATSGEILWKMDGGGFEPVTIVGDKIYYPTSSGEVIALKKTTGERVWTYHTNGGVPTGLRLFKGFLVFGESQGGLVFLNPQTGLARHTFFPGRGILATPQVSELDHKIYFISGESNVYAMEAKWEWPNWFSFVR